MATTNYRDVLTRLLDYFIPQAMTADPASYTRAQILVGVVLVNLFLSLLTIIGITLWMNLNTFNYIVAYAIVGQCVFLYSLSLYCLRVKSRFLLAGNITAFSIYSTVLVAVLITGGYSLSPFMQMFILVPVSVFLLVGLTSGLFWSVLIFLSLFALLFVERILGFEYQLLPQRDIDTFNRFLPFIIMSMIITALVIYELVSESLKKQLNREKNRFAFKASHDSLTDLPNREEFYERLRHGIRQCAVDNSRLALAYIDLDGFKPVNDTYGHHAGDKVLKSISHRIRNELRHNDTIARLGGDEFALILTNLKQDTDITRIVTKVLGLIERPVEIGAGKEVSVSASAGIAVCPLDSTNSEQLCQLADRAMYEAKNRHNTFEFVTSELAS